MEERILRVSVCDIIRPGKELPVQSQQIKDKNNVCKLFNIKNVNVNDIQY